MFDCRELIIVPPEGNNKSKYLKVFVDQNYKHVDYLIEYIRENSIDINTKDITSMYILGIEMAGKNYLVSCTNNLSFNSYVPLKLSDNQSKWFIDNKESISRLNISVASLNIEDKEVCIRTIEKDKSNNDPIKKLYKEIDKKSLKEEKGMVKKYGVIR